MVMTVFPFHCHAELVSASMACSRGELSIGIEVWPWTLKQVQGDEERKYD
jgi:hypothetical protein